MPPLMVPLEYEEEGSSGDTNIELAVALRDGLDKNSK